jgi:hypothetical protein
MYNTSIWLCEVSFYVILRGYSSRYLYHIWAPFLWQNLLVLPMTEPLTCLIHLHTMDFMLKASQFKILFFTS